MVDKVRDRRKSNWFWVNKTVIDDHAAEIGPYGLAIYCLLARHADESGRAIPSMAGIAKKLGMSRRSVITYLEKLKSCNLISIKHRIDEHGDATSNEYHLLNLGGATDSLGGAIDSPPSEQDTPQVVNEVHHGGEPDAHEQDPLNKTHLNNGYSRAVSQPGPKAIPEDFSVTLEMKTWAAEKTPDVDIEAETDAFVDWANGKKARKHDWVAIWRNWMRRTQKDAYRAPPRKKKTNEHEGHRVSKYPSGMYCHNCKRDVMAWETATP